jgi:Protein of unknown function (DUF4013)
MERIADAFAWPFRDPQWVSKVLVMGLILIIPIVGAIAGLGWMLAAMDRLRAGEERLPRANFDHFGRGFGLFVVFLVYYVVVLLLASVIFVPSVLILVAQGRDNPNAVLVSLGFGLLLVANSFVLLAGLVLTFAMPAVVLVFDRGGVAGGLNVKRVVKLAMSSLINTLIAGLMLIAAGIVGGFGLLFCFIGVYFTQAYALAMQAWIIRSFELGSKEVTDAGRATTA